MIPKIIHQIWLGSKPIPNKFIDSWKIPNFEHVLWREKELSNLNMVNRDKYQTLLENKTYYGAADIARVEILSKFGGMYADADFENLKPFPDEWFNYNFFSGGTGNKLDPDFRAGNSLFATKSESDIILEYRSRIKKTQKIHPCWKQIGGSLLTKVLINLDINRPDLLILPPLTFYTVTIKGKVLETNDQNDPRISQAYARHFMASKNSKIY